MIKNLLLCAAVVMGGFASAQTFDLLDENDNSIAGTTHYIYGSPSYLSETKFHVKNISGAQETYSCWAKEIENPLASDLQVCYGSNCYTAADGVAGQQTNGGTVNLAAGVTDNTFKAAPFTFTWGNPLDSAKWRVAIYDVNNPSDSVFADIVWIIQGVSVAELSKDDVQFSVYPNPVADNLNVSYNIDGDFTRGSIELYDVVGKQVSTQALTASSAKLQLDVSELNAGVYFYTIKVDGQALKTERVIIK
jgi:hypothetical protein